MAGRIVCWSFVSIIIAALCGSRKDVLVSSFSSTATTIRLRKNNNEQKITSNHYLHQHNHDRNRHRPLFLASSSSRNKIKTFESIHYHGWSGNNKNGRRRSCFYSATDDDNNEEVEAEDLEAIQALFAKHCDGEGLMTKKSLSRIPTIADLLKEEDLLQEELNDIWNVAPKFPDVVQQNKEQQVAVEERIDVDSFVQIYRDIDDLFEDDDDDHDDEDEDEDEEEEEEEIRAKQSEGKNDDGDDVVVVVPEEEEKKIATTAGEEEENADGDSSPAAVVVKRNDTVENDGKEEEEADDDDDDDEEEEELESIYESIRNEDGLLSKASLKQWNEIQKLLGDGLLGEDEFDDIWEKTPKRPGSGDGFLDVDGFLSFNVALDGLFEFDDDDDDADDDADDDEDVVEAVDSQKSTSSSSSGGGTAATSVFREDISPSMLFYTIANEDVLVGMDELKQWDELNDMISDGDLSREELRSIFDGIADAQKTKQLDEAGFVSLYEQIDDLFEDDDDDDDDDDSNNIGEVPQNTGPSVSPPPPPPRSATAATATTTTPASSGSGDSSSNTWKKELLRSIALVNSDEERLPCGLECTDREQERILNIATELEKETSINLLKQQANQQIGMADVAGDWELLYTSSSAMRFNKGLSGIGGSFPNGRFGGLVQTLKATKFLSDIEYRERITVQPEAASFDVVVDGNWNLRKSVSLFTGEPSLVLNVVPDTVTYGPTSTRADHWKSLGPTNMLDITYLDENLRIMRGNTSTDTLFVFQRMQ